LVAYFFAIAKFIDRKKKDDFFKSSNEKGLTVQTGLFLSRSTWPGPEGSLEVQTNAWIPGLSALPVVANWLRDKGSAAYSNCPYFLARLANRIGDVFKPKGPGQ
jgi:hypothetical protein